MLCKNYYKAFFEPVFLFWLAAFCADGEREMAGGGRRGGTCEPLTLSASDKKEGRV